MTIKYLFKEHIIAIHQELIERFGGLHGIRDASLLESAIGRYQSGYYADCIEEAAALMESLGGNHPFIDGNKRIAVTSPIVFLMINGYEALLDDQTAFDFINDLFEAHEFSFARLEPWIRKNVKLVAQFIEDAENQAPTEVIEAKLKCLEALNELIFALRSLRDSYTKWDDEITLLASYTGNRQRAIENLRNQIAADLDRYSQRIDEVGDKYVKAWVTATEWDMTAISNLKDQGLLRELMIWFQTVRANTIQQRQEMTALSKTLQMLSRGFSDLQEFVDRCTKSHTELDEQLKISTHRCDEILSLTKTRLAKLISAND